MYGREGVFQCSQRLSQYVEAEFRLMRRAFSVNLVPTIR